LVRPDAEVKESTNSTLTSNDFETSGERVATLKEHIKCYSDFSDAEFELFNVNGNFNNERLTVPGGSSWDYIFVLQLEADSIDNWTSGMIPLDKKVVVDSISWVVKLNEMLTNKVYIGDSGQLFERTRDANYAVVFRKSGLVFRKIVNR